MNYKFKFPLEIDFVKQKRQGSRRAYKNGMCVCTRIFEFILFYTDLKHLKSIKNAKFHIIMNNYVVKLN